LLELIKRNKYAMPAWSGAVVHLTESVLLLGNGDLPYLLVLRGHENVCEKHAQLKYNQQRGWTLESLGGRCRVGSAQKNWPPSLAENPVSAGDKSGRTSGSSVVVELNHEQEEVALGSVTNCFWFPDTPFCFLLNWPEHEGDPIHPPPGLPRPSRGDEALGDEGRAAEERHAGKRSREGSAGAARDGQADGEGEQRSRDDGSDMSGSRRQRRKDKGNEDGKGGGASAGEK